MAEVFGNKSEYLIKKDRNNFMVASVLMIVMLFSIFAYWNFYFQESGNEILGQVAVIFVVVILISKYIGERSLNKSIMFGNGRSGEYAVCDELKKLPDQYVIFRNIKFENRGDIDLVVTGPSGIFAIEVKSHKGNIYFNPNCQKLERNHKALEKDFMGQAKAGAFSLKKRLTRETGVVALFVDAVLVFSNKNVNLRFPSDIASNIQIVKKESLNNLIISNIRKITEQQLLLVNEKLSDALQRRKLN